MSDFNPSDSQSGTAWVPAPVAFFCRSCQHRAQMIEVDGVIRRMECPSCGTAVKGGNAQNMIAQLLDQFRRQVGADSIGVIGFPAISSAQAVNEFINVRWPFEPKLDD